VHGSGTAEGDFGIQDIGRCTHLFNIVLIDPAKFYFQVPSHLFVITRQVLLLSNYASLSFATFSTFCFIAKGNFAPLINFARSRIFAESG